jgi:hypothetical protein
MAMAVTDPIAKPARWAPRVGTSREKRCAVKPICANNPRAMPADRVRNLGSLQSSNPGNGFAAGDVTEVGWVPSGHLARMATAGLLSVEKQGRHRYHRLASPAVARMIESIMQVASMVEAPRRLTVGPRDAALRAARTCYDHLAGRLGVALADALIAGGHLEMAAEAGLLTDRGAALLGRIGIDVDALMADRGRRSARILCRPCLDWSERRPHIAGALGAAFCARSLAKGWIRRIEGTRAVTLTPKGQRLFREELGVRLD